jgi:hypothetical protein
MRRVVAAVLAVFGGGLFGVGSLASVPPGSAAARAADRRCGEILSAHSFYAVTVHRGNVSCARAQRVLRVFMAGGGVKHGGRYAYQQWWSLGHWRCSFGAGAAGCADRSAGAAILAEWVAWQCGHKPPGATAPCKKLALASLTRAGTAATAFNTVSRAHLRPTPLWPAYLPVRIRRAQWTVESLRGVEPYPPYPDYTAIGPGGFSVFYGYRVSSGGFGGGGFSRTTHGGLYAALRASRVNEIPRHRRLGGRIVVEFRPGSTATFWAFSTSSGVYVFSSKDYGGPSPATIGRMIASMRPITHLRPPPVH